jgi:hypothetical protein
LKSGACRPGVEPRYLGAGTSCQAQNYFKVIRQERPMKALVAAAALLLMCGSALAQNTGPAPQTGMEKPGMTSGAREDGSMDTTGMSAAKGNIKREKDGAPAPAKKDDARK